MAEKPQTQDGSAKVFRCVLPMGHEREEIAVLAEALADLLAEAQELADRYAAANPTAPSVERVRASGARAEAALKASGWEASA